METWREIVAEMRNTGRFGELNPTMGGIEMKTPMHDFADRIEAECRTLEENGRIAIQSAQARHDEEVNALKCENAKLRRALEPVMKVDLSDETTFTEKEIILSVSKAQAIMKEGVK